MEVSKNGLALIKRFEGYSASRYICPAGIPTIGYGSTRWWNGEPIPLGATVTYAEAEQLKARDLIEYQQAVNNLIAVPLKQNQFDALVSFVYNVGVEAFAGSTLRRLINQGDFTGAAEQFDRWVWAGGQRLPGLVGRRDQEEALFLSSVQAGILNTEWHAVAYGQRLLRLTQPMLTGADVSNVQRALNAKGFALATDGVFGPLTAGAVTQFQRDSGLVPDGIVGPRTRAALGV